MFVAPAVGGVAPRGSAFRAERFVMGTARRLPGIVLVEHGGHFLAFDGEMQMCMSNVSRLNMHNFLIHVHVT